MSTVGIETRSSLEVLERSCDAAAARFRSDRGDQIETYRRLISDGID